MANSVRVAFTSYTKKITSCTISGCQMYRIMQKEVFLLYLTFIASLLVVGCVGNVQITPKGSHVRFMTDVDRPNCSYLKQVSSGAGSYFNSYEGNFEAGFNAAMNAVAEAGGDAYVVSRNDPTGQIYELKVWRCNWRNIRATTSGSGSTQPIEIFDVERPDCEFIKSVAEGSNWGITESRNTKSASEDAVKRVQQAGGNAYFIVGSIANRFGAGFIIEAWHCGKFDPAEWNNS